MAQTSDGISMIDCKLEYSVNGSDWTDVSGYAASVDPGSHTRKTGLAYTFDGDTAIIRSGKREPIDLNMRVVYTEGSADPFRDLLAYHEAGSQVYFRYSPKGGDSGEEQFTSDAGYMTDFPWPGGEAESGDVVMLEWKFQCPKLTRGTA